MKVKHFNLNCITIEILRQITTVKIEQTCPGHNMIYLDIVYDYICIRVMNYNDFFEPKIKYHNSGNHPEQIHLFKRSE